jgi:tetratricopeptide (TPR) repeat protein
MRWLLISCCWLIIGFQNTLSAQQQDGVNFAIFRDRDTFTLFLPAAEGEQTVSLNGLRLEVGDHVRSYPLTSFRAFAALSFGHLPTPLCLHLRRSQSTTPLPMVCSGVMTIRQELGSFDVFWHQNEQDLTVLVKGGDGEVVCPAGSSYCELRYVPPAGVSSESGLPSTVDTLLPTISSSDAPIFNISGDVGAIISQSQVQELTINVGDSPAEAARKARLRADTIASEVMGIVRNIDSRLAQVDAALSPDLFGEQLSDIRATAAPAAQTLFGGAYRELFLRQQMSDLRQIFADTALPNSASPSLAALVSESVVNPFDIQFFYDQLNEINIISNNILRHLERLSRTANEDKAWVSLQQDILAVEVQTLLNRSQLAYLTSLRIFSDLKNSYPDMPIVLETLLYLEPRSLVSPNEVNRHFDEYLRQSLNLVTIRAGLFETGQKLVNADLDAYTAVSADLAIRDDDPWNIVIAKAISLRQLGRITESVAAFARYGEMFSTSDDTAERYSQIAQQFTLQAESLGIIYGAIYIYEVLPGTPAAKAGLSAGDIIVEFDGQNLTGPIFADGEEMTAIEFMQTALQNMTIGEEIPVAYLRLSEDGTFTRTAITLVAEGLFGFGLMPI